MTPGVTRHRLSWWTLRVHWLLGILLLAVYTQISAGSLLFVTAAWIGGVWMDAQEMPRKWLSRLGAVLVGILLAVSAANLLFAGGDLLSCASFLLIGIQATRMILPKNAREGWQLCALSFLEFLVAASITDEISFAFFAFLFLAASAGAMWSLHDQGEEQLGRPSGGYMPSGRTAAWTFLLVAVGGFLMTAALFVAVPRLEFRRMFYRFSPKNAVSGFSDKITLNEITNIKSDRRVAARVEFPFLEGEPPIETLYLKGAVYSRYSSDGWQFSRFVPSAVTRAGFRYLLREAPRSPVIVADITLESASHSRMFTYGEPFLIETNVGPLLSDWEGNLFLLQDGHPTLQYRLLFTQQQPRREAAYPRRHYLEFPPDQEDIRSLAIQIVEGATTDEERVARLLGFFQKGFRYSLTSPASTLQSFLFDEKSGYCEHYAAGLALLLRAVDIPSRVAAGYFGGEWNLLGRYLIVRQSDAHAWVEAWVGGRWVTLDATPSQEEESPFYRKTGFLGLYADWFRYRWEKYVMNYSLRMQANAVQAGMSGLRRALRTKSFAGLRQILPASAVAILLWFLWRTRRRRRETAREENALPAPYKRLVQRLESTGYRPFPGIPMAEMLEAAVRAYPDLAKEAQAFLSLYHQDRFGQRPLPPNLREEALLRANQLKRQISL